MKKPLRDIIQEKQAFGAATMRGAHIYQVRKRYKEIEKKNV